MPRPESYRTIAKCCATCHFYDVMFRYCSHDFNKAVSGAIRVGDKLVESHGLCDEYQPYAGEHGKDEP